MNKLLLALTVFVAGFLGLGLVAAPVSAAEDPLASVCAQNPGASACQEPDRNPIYGPNGVVTRVTQLLIFVIGFAAVMTIIIAGFRYVTSAGDPQRAAGAKDAILYAVIGLVVALLAQVIVSFVLRRL